MTRATWVLKIPRDSPWVVDVFRHWDFSICSNDIGVMAVLMEGCDCKIQEKMDFCGRSNFLYFYWLYPSTKRAITPMSFEQIEKFQCLKVSTILGLSHGIFRTHVARVTCPETCLKGWQTLRSKKSKNRNYLIQPSIRSSCVPSQLSKNIRHPYGGIFYNDWGHGGSVDWLKF